jgi:hypothetical protein
MVAKVKKEKDKEEVESTTKEEDTGPKPMFVFKRVTYKFMTEVLSTCTEIELYNEHVLKKAQKEIAKANKLHGKIIKSLEKYKGTEITEQKEFEELKAVLRAYQERVGKREPLPDNITDLLAYSKEVSDEYELLLAKGETQKSTVFMRNEDGHAMLSTHMIIGNYKENLKSLINNSAANTYAITSKVSTGEIMATDVKVVEDFVIPSQDLVRKPNGEPDILERPIRFDRMGQTKTAIAMSEYLPIGSEITFTLRIRSRSPFLSVLADLLEMGKNNGIGQWRGSGKKGTYMHKIEDCDDPGHSWQKDGWK